MAADIQLRAAATYGDVLATVMDGQVRLFDLPLTEACRLQAFVSPSQGAGVYGNLTVCESFFAKLVEDVRHLPGEGRCVWDSVLDTRKQVVEPWSTAPSICSASTERCRENAARH